MCTNDVGTIIHTISVFNISVRYYSEKTVTNCTKNQMNEYVVPTILFMSTKQSLIYSLHSLLRVSSLEYFAININLLILN